MNTAVLYVRISTLNQRVDSQEQELKRFCRQRGWKNLSWYVDKISGAKSSRPELDRLLGDRARCWEGIATHCVSDKGPKGTAVAPQLRV